MVDRIKHEYFDPPPAHIIPENSWFNITREDLASGIFMQEDIRFSRLLIANMLSEAFDKNRFDDEYSTLNNPPNETDRTLLICYLQFLASITGLLSGEEIREMQHSFGNVNITNYLPIDGALLSFEEVSAVTEKWKQQGYTIYLFQGGFNPPTVIHLARITEMYTMGNHQYNGLFKTVVAFDADIALQLEKGLNYKVYPCSLRRKILGGLWSVDVTVKLRKLRYRDHKAQITDYEALNVDYVALAPDQAELDDRILQIESAGAKPTFLTEFPDSFHATELLETLQK